MGIATENLKALILLFLQGMSDVKNRKLEGFDFSEISDVENHAKKILDFVFVSVPRIQIH